MTDDLPEPPIAADVDLKDFPFTPMYRARLFGSSFHARANDAEWRAGVTLWLKSQDQVPAGSLPEDDVDLCRLAELGRDVRTWKRLKSGAMHGWAKHSDGRLYHTTVTEVTNGQWISKLRQRWRTYCARLRKQAQRNKTEATTPSFEEWMSGGQLADVTEDTRAMSRGTENNVTRDRAQCHVGQPPLSHVTKANVPRENPSKGQRREERGIGILEEERAEAIASVGPARARAAPATRLHPNFVMPPDWAEDGASAREKAHLPPVDLATEAIKFTNHFISKAGKEGAKLNWHRTWINWCLNAKGNANGARRYDRAAEDAASHARALDVLARAAIEFDEREGRGGAPKTVARPPR